MALAPRVARADVDHIVAKGHTLEAIAARYHVTKRAILEKNPGMSPSRLQPGDVLTIPTPKAGAKTAAGVDKDPKRSGAADKGGKPAEPKTYAQRPKTPGVLKVKRLATNEEYTFTLPKGFKFTPTTLRAFEKMMRAPSGVSHPVEPRLMALLRVVSNHFGGRPIEVVSGFRPFTTTQYNPHSNHNHGKAIDFRVVGVPNEVLRDYCRTLRNTGCGYSNSVFVHMDAGTSRRSGSTTRPAGPEYHAPGVDADEGQTECTRSTARRARRPAPSPPSPRRLPRRRPSLKASRRTHELLPPHPVEERLMRRPLPARLGRRRRGRAPALAVSPRPRRRAGRDGRLDAQATDDGARSK